MNTPAFSRPSSYFHTYSSSPTEYGTKLFLGATIILLSLLIPGSSAFGQTKLAPSTDSSRTVSLGGTLSSPVTVSPASLTFASSAVGTKSGAQTVTLTNHLSTSLPVSAAATGDFAVTSNTCGASLGPGRSCTVGVTFTPTGVGVRAGALTLSYRASGSPIVTPLSGPGNANGLISIVVTPANPSIALGQTEQFTATGHFRGGSTQNLTASVAWGSTAPGVATITAAGLASSVSAGSTTIVATLETITPLGRATRVTPGLPIINPPTRPIGGLTTLTVTGPVLVSSVSPNSGSTAGGTVVTIAGTNFAADATVMLGVRAATNVVVVTGTQITATTPAAVSAGAVTVTVTNPGAQSGSLANAFTYMAVLPLKASSNNRYLVDQNGTPWLLMGDSPQSVICATTPSDMATYMSARQSQGFNALVLDAICTTYTDPSGDPGGTAFDGTPPFTSGSSPLNYDLSTPNPAYFTELDAMINLAASYGLVAFLDPIETGGWRVTLENNGAAKAYTYGAYLGNRYKNFTNIVWLSGNDFQTWNTSTTDNNLVYQVMLGIASADTNHLQSIELNYDFSYSNQDTTLSNVLTADGAYTYLETYDCVLQAYASSSTMPTYLVEANYEGNNITENLPGLAGTYVLREQAYWTLTSGGVGQLWGNTYFVGFLSGWQSQLNSPGALEIQYINQLFSNFSWWNLVPDTTHQVVIAGYGTYDGNNGDLPAATYCTTSWITYGSVALTYCPNATTLTLNLAEFSGPVTAQWYDPSNGTYTAISGLPFPNSGTQDFTTPGNNHDGDPDWVLVISPPPGS